MVTASLARRMQLAGGGAALGFDTLPYHVLREVCQSFRAPRKAGAWHERHCSRGSSARAAAHAWARRKMAECAAEALLAASAVASAWGAALVVVAAAAVVSGVDDDVEKLEMLFAADTVVGAGDGIEAPEMLAVPVLVSFSQAALYAGHAPLGSFARRRVTRK